MIGSALATILGTVIALLPIANPFSTAALFLGLTTGQSSEEREVQARRACLYMAAILITFLVAGTLIMRLFGISLPGIRMAGGLMVAMIGFRMLHPAEEEDVSEDVKRDSRRRDDISFMPLAMPSLSGPGAIAVTIGLAAQSEGVINHIAIAVGIIASAAVCYFALRAATPVVKFLGPTGLDALTRIMGFLLLCIGVQFIVTGVNGFITDPSFLEALIEALEAVQTP
ncbi:MAG: MarC family NAAT transporter [Alphaproteobacteria bacterium]|nr:MarC family NAAT transporter [Alphaproteobacteria bacterium]